MLFVNVSDYFFSNWAFLRKTILVSDCFFPIFIVSLQSQYEYDEQKRF